MPGYKKFNFANGRLVVPPPKSKYGNVRTTVGSETFDSASEAERFRQLVLLQKAGQIRELSRQVSFVLAPAVVINGEQKRALTYRADFGYFDVSTGKHVVEDRKGALTDVYKLKRHLMKSVHNVDILET